MGFSIDVQKYHHQHFLTIFQSFGLINVASHMEMLIEPFQDNLVDTLEAWTNVYCET